ncbi:MAG: DUF2946 family protein [Microvirga sp.]
MAAAAALLGVLLYTALVAAHVVSQATSLATRGAHAAAAQSTATGDPGCHETQPSAGKAKDSNRGLPAAPAKKCPFCAGYAAFQLSVVGDLASILLGEDATTHFRGLSDVLLIEPTSSHSWHPRAPPLLG